MKKILFIIPFFLLFALPLTGKAALLMPDQTENATTTTASSLPEQIAPISPAAITKDFTFVTKDQNFVIPALTVGSWKGSVTISTRNLLTRPHYSLKDYLIPKAANKSTASDLVSYNHSIGKIYDHVKELASKLNTPAVEPAMKIENGRAAEFTPPQIGQKVDIRQTTLEALAALERGRTTSTISIEQTKPKTTLTQLNNLGISELIAQGESNFTGSPKNRRHNIEVGVEKMKGLIIKQGEEFSFNHYLGEVTKEAGFLPELVIKRTGTVPELGGGLCQVSSTAFRAAMNGGLPITQRRNHAYAVQYYAPQGTDATIYPGVVDFKFVNDTPGDLLIWPYLKDKNTLIFDFYGTKDDRKVVLEKPIQWDRKTDGSMKASWTREVFKNGTSTKDIFKSAYVSPALFHKEESFVAGSTTTTASQTNTAPPTDQNPSPPSNQTTTQ